MVVASAEREKLNMVKEHHYTCCIQQDCVEALGKFQLILSLS